ncbi:hypothetical protein AB0I35_03870 [Nocardia sp. NPDC050378]|uniref:hypothetical protein n=1 Tax=Nocardia sp. NPDC050378 TaxID=3155400 RepID=UPI0033DECEC2
MTATLLIAAGALGSCSESHTAEEPDRGLLAVFDPCRDTSADFRSRHRLNEPEYTNVYNMDGSPRPVDEAFGCAYSTPADEQGFSMVIGFSRAWNHGTLYGGEKQQFTQTLIAGRESEISCATIGVDEKPYCDALISFNESEILFEVRYWLPQGSIDRFKTVTEAKLIELATEVMEELPHGR